MSSNDELNFFTPKDLPSLLQLLKSYPDATIVAGASSFPIKHGKLEIQPKYPIININEIEELKKIRTIDSGLEIGGGASLASIFKVPSKRLSPLLTKTLLHLSSYPIFFQATLGGNLCLKPYPGDLFLPLVLLGASFELRSFASSRWIDSSRFIEMSQITLKTSEILTKVKIPESTWNITSYYSNQSTIYPKIPVRVAFIARISKKIIEDLRFGVQLPDSPLIIQRTVDEGLVGKTLPINRRDISWMMNVFCAKMINHGLEACSPHYKLVNHLIMENFREINDYESNAKFSKKE